MNDLIENSHLLNNQIFAIVMGGLYAIAALFGTTYKAVNIYFYFVLFPASFALSLKWKYKWIIPILTLLFFLVPGYREFSDWFFDQAVDFLNASAAVFHSNYINMSVYLCVVLPLLLYLLAFYLRYGKKIFLRISLGLFAVFALYMIGVYPFFKDVVISLAAQYALR